jgi:hypothetical protein
MHGPAIRLLQAFSRNAKHVVRLLIAFLDRRNAKAHLPKPRGAVGHENRYTAAVRWSL